MRPPSVQGTVATSSLFFGVSGFFSFFSLFFNSGRPCETGNVEFLLKFFVISPMASRSPVAPPRAAVASPDVTPGVFDPGGGAAPPASGDHSPSAPFSRQTENRCCFPVGQFYAPHHPPPFCKQPPMAYFHRNCEAVERCVAISLMSSIARQGHLLLVQQSFFFLFFFISRFSLGKLEY